MSEYYNLFNDICDRTKKHEIEWKQVDRYSFQNLIFNSSNIYRLYKSNYLKNGETYILLLIEKKFRDEETDHDKLFMELLVTQNNEVISELDESIIERYDLIDLIQIVSRLNDKSKKLYE